MSETEHGNSNPGSLWPCGWDRSHDPREAQLFATLILSQAAEHWPTVPLNWPRNVTSACASREWDGVNDKIESGFCSYCWV